MSAALPKGTRLAGFVLDEPLGQGGFGITYRARSADRARSYAIKEYFPESVAQRLPDNRVVARPGAAAARQFEAGRSAFLSEAYLLRDLPRQPGLVRVRGAFEKYGTAYCLMDFIAGEPLDRRVARFMARHGAVSEARVVVLFTTLCHALAAVHAAGFVHCDIKPANVMIGRDGAPVLIDFGAARRLNAGCEHGAMLSRRYAAPEQYPNPPRPHALPQGPWTDVFALSVMLYEIVSQSPPLDAARRMQDCAAGRPDPCLPIRENLRRNRVEEEYSDALLDLLDRGMALAPRARPQSAAECLAALPGAGPARKAWSVPDGAGSAPQRDWPRIAIMLGLILGLALLAAAYGMMASGGGA